MPAEEVAKTWKEEYGGVRDSCGHPIEDGQTPLDPCKYCERGDPIK